MQINGPGHIHGPQQINAPHAARPTQVNPARPASAAGDELQISSEGNLLSKIHDMPEIRADRVAEIQAAIANGSYETADKLDVALDRLLDEIA